MEGSQGIEDRRHMQTPMVAEARNSRYQTCSKVPSKRQALAHIQSPTTDAAAPNKTKVKWTFVINSIVSVGWFNPAIINA